MIVGIHIIGNTIIIIIQIAIIAYSIPVKINPFSAVARKFIDKVMVCIAIIIGVDNIT